MKRIFSIFSRDMVSNTREFLIVYILISPLLLALGLRFFIPSVDATTGLTFALDARVEEEIRVEFLKYGQVELYTDIEELKNRVSGIDDVSGVIKLRPGEYQLVSEGNESNQVGELILRNYSANPSSPIEYEFTDLGYELSPVASVGTVSLIITAIIMGGVLIGLGIIEDKESKIISSLNVTPLTRGEYIVGKSFVGLFITIIETYLILWIVQMTNIHLGMVLLIALVSSFIAVLSGFVIGVTSSNQMSAIATIKILFLPISISIIGAIVLPQNLQFLLFWSPIYWSYLGLYNIVVNSATWGQLGTYSLWIIGLTGLIFLLFKNKIRRGLA